MNDIYKFWEKYIKLDYLERKKLLEKLIPKVNDFIHSDELDKDFKDKMLAHQFQSYFDDLIEYMRSKDE